MNIQYSGGSRCGPSQDTYLVDADSSSIRTPRMCCVALQGRCDGGASRPRPKEAEESEAQPSLRLRWNQSPHEESHGGFRGDNGGGVQNRRRIKSLVYV